MRQKRNFLTETFFVGSGKAERAFSKNDFFVGNGLILVRIFFLFRRFDDKKMLVIEGKKMKSAFRHCKRGLIALTN